MSADRAFEFLDDAYRAAPEFETSAAGRWLALDDPGRRRLAIDERVRPDMDRRFLGRYDTP
jgi:hypothetical protein